MGRANDARAAYKEVLGRKLPPAPDEAPVEVERVREMQSEIMAAEAEVERLRQEMASGRMLTEGREWWPGQHLVGVPELADNAR